MDYQIFYPASPAYGKNIVHLEKDGGALCESWLAPGKWSLFRLSFCSNAELCPECELLKSEADDIDVYDTYIYIIHSHTTYYYKIGISNDIDRRMRNLQNASPNRLGLEWSDGPFTKRDARSIEQASHQHFDDLRVQIGRSVEWFYIPPGRMREVKEYIASLIE